MTFGSRFAGLGDPIGGGMPLYRYVGNRVTTIAENLMLGSRFSATAASVPTRGAASSRCRSSGTRTTSCSTHNCSSMQ